MSTSSLQHQQEAIRWRSGDDVPELWGVGVVRGLYDDFINVH